MECQPVIIIDTHVWIWAVNKNFRLGRSSRSFLESVDEIGVSAITPWEIALLARKDRLGFGVDIFHWIKRALSDPKVRLLPLDPLIAVESTRLPAYPSGDPADRILIATAQYLNVPLMTADHVILAYGARGEVQVIDAEK